MPPYVSYFVPLIGGIIADSWWGKYKTIFYLSIVYTLGMLMNAISAIPSVGGYGKTLEDNMVHVALHITGLGHGDNFSRGLTYFRYLFFTVVCGFYIDLYIFISIIVCESHNVTVYPKPN